MKFVLQENEIRNNNKTIVWFYKDYSEQKIKMSELSKIETEVKGNVGVVKPSDLISVKYFFKDGTEVFVDCSKVTHHIISD